MGRELIIYTDESADKGTLFSNFYGGLLVESADHYAVSLDLSTKIAQLGFTDEVKWEKVNAFHQQRFLDLMDAFFMHVRDGRVKVRVMFTQNQFARARLTPEQREQGFYILYYQFIKHAFGLRFAGVHGERTAVRLMMDQLPDTREHTVRFKGYLSGLSRGSQFQHAGIYIPGDGISEVDSKKSPLLQCLDVVLGAMHFRLNNLDKVVPPGQRRRGKRTVAKANVFRRISTHVRGLRTNFNIGITTGKDRFEDLWHHPYRHWRFVSRVGPEDGVEEE